jgi:hypothetical protein
MQTIKSCLVTKVQLLNRETMSSPTESEDITMLNDQNAKSGLEPRKELRYSLQN